MLALTLLAALSPAQPAGAATAYQLLQTATQPVFRVGHTLPRLTRWGWSMSFDTRKELCDHWGYALEWGDASTSAVKNLDNPASTESQICALTASDPVKYPLFVLEHRPLLDNAYIASLPDATWCHDASGNVITNVQQWRRYSLIMPDSVYQGAAVIATGALARIRQACPISIVLNGGEYGLSVYGWSGSTWTQDPAVVTAKGTNDWYAYLSARKAHYEQIITGATLAQLPDLGQYIWYSTAGDHNRTPTGNSWQYTWDYACMWPISTLPNDSMYYGASVSWTTEIRDMLTMALNSTAYEIKFGQPLSYNWVCGGDDTNGVYVSDAPRYMGWLKCYYTAGMIGGIAGYFTYPPGGFTSGVGATIPSWLQQMMTLGQVHGLFSHVEDFECNGDLLPGPNVHRWSTDLPAYEFPTGYANTRVLARRHRDRPEWLICAWAADATNRNVTVTIPDLGAVTLFARDSATLYRAKPGPVLVQLDADGMLPSLHLHDIVATNGPNGTIFSAGNVAVPDGASETFSFTPSNGCQVTNVVVDGVSVGAPSSYTFANVTTNHTLAVFFNNGLAPLGTPLWWLAQYGWTNNVAAAETADTDGDAVPAWREYLAGTDPTDPLSRPDYNTVPYAESFENLTGWGGVYGSVFGHMGWSSSSPADDQSRITNLVYALRVANRPLPASTHTNVLRLSTVGAVLTNSFGPGYAMNGAKTYVDMVVQWVPNADTSAAWTPTDTGVKCGVYANGSSNLAIYHGVADADGTLLSNVVDATTVVVDPTTWYRLTIAIDATATNPAQALAMFQVRVNGAAVSNVAAYPDGWKTQFDATGLLPPTCASGTWFRLATTNELAKTLMSMNLEGQGYLDDLVVTNGDPLAVTAPSPATTIIIR